jgi:soluble cytochrome b562
MSPIADKPFTRTLAAVAVAGVLALSLDTGYADEAKKDEGTKPATEVPATLTNRETVAQYAGWEDPDMARIAVHGGRALLRHVQAAHAALKDGKVGEARSALTAADDFAEGLQLMIPYSVVVDNIRNTEHELLASSTGIVVDDMLPIYSSLDEMADFAPELAEKAKAKLDEANKHMQKGEKEKAAEKLEEVAADISSTTVYLPVLYVESQVEAARHALDQDPPDTKTATSAVDNAMLSLVHATVNMHLFPEEKAAGKEAPATASKADASKTEATKTEAK